MPNPQKQSIFGTSPCAKKSKKLSGGNLSDNHIQEGIWRHFRVLSDSEVSLGVSRAKNFLEALNVRVSDAYLRLCGALW